MKFMNGKIVELGDLPSTFLPHHRSWPGSSGDCIIAGKKVLNDKKSLKDLSSLLWGTNLGTTEVRKIQPKTREKFERGISPRKSNWRFNDRTKSPELSLCLRLCYNYKSGFTRGRPQQSKSAATTRFFPSSAKFTSGVHYHRLTLQRNISKALMTRKRGPPLPWLPRRVFWKESTTLNTIEIMTANKNACCFEELSRSEDDL